ncbi:pyridoxamine 5'-phosphate oxidase family protein [Yinghuangia soli]|uniref:Pyridoxamine 5'-phosphate oxidase family protein n=1 Tax=Yinghuangia soli TaxID=2908204 RepID=A0AA41TWQ4_9ACTN|nr:pyridoxamine 5'-phosphate oxidase family protein [Yinghuangia soli]MCF2526078.1 pyridoxamine 5'-phosphate oxidase family protein [Yinghuangia soli]
MTTTPMPVLEELSAAEALRLMAGVPVGRVVFTEGALPAIRPVHFVLDDGGIVFRIVGAQRLADGLHNTVVAFQTDEYQADRGDGWTVTATGHATRITDQDEIARLARQLPLPWSDRGHMFRIEPELVTGRRLTR